MRLSPLVALAAAAVTTVAGRALVSDASYNIAYHGVERNGIEIFLGIPYGQDTSGENRFKPPRPYTLPTNSTFNATQPGPACPQPLGQLLPPLALGNVTNVSEDCLNLNVARPKGVDAGAKLPVMMWIHGGSFWFSSNSEPTTAPDGLVLQSVESGNPIIHVALNYRLGFFGFAQSATLKGEGSENAGLRDQRLAVEWVRDNIKNFGGDPEQITIFGQSSGGLAVGMQILAYGGEKPLPFQQGIAQSQALEPGITGNFTKDAMAAVMKYVGCNSTLDAPETINCLRGKDTSTLLDAAINTWQNDIAHNVGDIWLPVVDGDFLPAAPSQLIAEGRIGDATFMTGWTQDDLNIYTDVTIANANDTYNFIRAYLPALPEPALADLLALYPSSEFTAGKDLAAEFYRSSRIFRDIIMTCPSLLLGAGVDSTHENPVFLYNWNTTLLDDILALTMNISGLGVVHTSEYAYVFNNVSVYSDYGFPPAPGEEDFALAKRASGSWAAFAESGAPSSTKNDSGTLQGWKDAYWRPGGPYVMTIGGPHAGMSPLSGPGATPEIAKQRLVERCGFLNSPEIIAGLQF